MRIPSGVTDQYIYFVAVDATDLKTRETGLATFTVYRSRNGGAAAAFTTPTINETDSTNMPGVYELLLDEDMTIDSGDDSQAVALHITHSGMAPVSLEYELYRPKITAGETVTAGSGRVNADMTAISTDTTAADNAESFFDGTGYKDTDNLYIVRASTAQAGAAGTITLDASASAVDDFYNNTMVFLTGGTGANQARVITDYVGSTKVATVGANWATTPDNTSTFVIFPGAGAISDVNVTQWNGTAVATPDTAGYPKITIKSGTGTGELSLTSGVASANAVQISGDSTAADNLESAYDGTGYKDPDNLYIVRSSTATAGAAGTITLDASASAVDDFYNNTFIFISSGTGANQARFISDYVGSTKVATVNANWVTNPDNTSVFIIFPFGTLPGASAPSASDIWSHATRVLTASTNISGMDVNVASVSANAINANAIAADAITAAKIAADAIGASELAADAVTEIAAGVFARAFSAAYGSLTFDEMVKVMAAALVAKASGLATTTATYRNLADNADVIVATVDADGNRSAVTLTP